MIITEKGNPRKRSVFGGLAQISQSARHPYERKDKNMPYMWQADLQVCTSVPLLQG